MRLLQVAGEETMTYSPNVMITNDGTDVPYKIIMLRGRTQIVAADLRKLEHEQELFTLKYHDLIKMTAHLQQISSQPTTQSAEIIQQIQKQITQQEQFLTERVAALIQLRLELVDKLKETCQILTQLQSHVLDGELEQWKRQQQLAGNGANFDNNLDTLQDWCESLAEFIWLTRQQLKELDRLKETLALDSPGVTDVLPQLLAEVTQLVFALVRSTFVIEKQPPQVLKKSSKFSATARLLVGGKLNVYMTSPQVIVSIVSESQAKVLLNNGKPGKSGEILNNTATMVYQPATGQLAASFKNMQLSTFKRTEKKGTESVMEEKFALLFESHFSVGGGELVYRVWTLSLPVVVVVHGNQEPDAWATVTWDNAFGKPRRVPFVVPDKAPWGKIAKLLSLKFESATGRRLTEDNLRFLAEKAFRGNWNGTDNAMLSWAQFCKECLSERSFTFWQWFYAIMKLTREHLKELWIDGAIMGFVRKNQAEELLNSCTDGTFLLRFSDSEKGGITISWITDKREVFGLQPITSKDFESRTLADQIADLNHLVYLYPNIPKNLPFGKYYTNYKDNQPSLKNGYVKGTLKWCVPGFTEIINTQQPPRDLSPDVPQFLPSSSYADLMPTPETMDITSEMDISQLDICNLDLNGVAILNELIQFDKF